MNEWSRLKLVTAATTDAVTLAEVKRHLRVDFDDDDAEIRMYLDAAVATIEGPHGIGICLTPQTWRLSLDWFPCEIVLPLGPVTEISSITYTDATGAPATVGSWRADLDVAPVRIWPERDAVWPTVTCEPGAVKVEFVAGFETVPLDLRAATLLLTGHYYEHREPVVTDKVVSQLPLSVDTILNRYRVGRVA